ncbi:MAG: hypothetical protein J5602_01165 [Clostridia bacterium]|nr:hypothetical protein [Clostridia bacterium]
MKKWMSVLVAIMLVLSMTTAFAADVPSKTTSDLADVVAIETSTDVAVAPDFVVEVVDDTTMTLEEVDELFEYVAEEGNAPIDYFDEDVQAAILESLNENLPATSALVLDDLKNWEINEFLTIDSTGYDPKYGDVTVTFEFATPYQVGQKVVGLLACYDGTRTEVAPNQFKFNAEWLVLDAEVIEADETSSKVNVTFTKDDFEKMTHSVSTALAILSEPIKE